MDVEELALRLTRYPELKVHFEELVTIIENPKEETTLADVAEQRIIDQLRDLGHDALQNWGVRQSEQTSAQIEKKVSTARKNTKKKSVGTQLME